MKRLLGIMIAILTMTSQASTSQSGNELYGKPTVTVAQPKTATRNAPAYVKAHRIPKFKVLRSNPHRYAKIIIDDVDYEVDDEGLMSPYRRKDLNKIEHEDGISERVRWRLFLARQLAMLKHKEVWG